MKASIKLIDPNTVVRVKPMCYSPQDRIEFTKQINELLDLKLIFQSKSPYMSPAFLVENKAEKRRGKKKIVVNYKKINEATVGDSHNLPNMQELLTLLRGKSIFSSFDCKSGFWQVLLDEQSQLLTAFTCPDGHFQWKVVPFGLKQAPSIFQRHMQNVLRGLENFCTVYVDGIIVFSENKEKHYIHVLEVLKTISKHGIILSKKKVNLFKNEINFLGLEIDQGTHSPQKHILEHLHNFPDALEDKKQLQRFLGVLTYAETYIEKLARMRKPLQGKLKKEVVWNWTQSDTYYVKKIKKNLTIFPKLYLPSNEDFLIIETDSSEDIWGGILKAKTPDNDEKIYKFTSGSFKAAEKNYHSNEKELLAVKNVISKFSAYLTPVTFLIQKIKEEYRDQRFKLPQDKDQDIFKPPMKFEQFRLIWNKARAACPEDFLHEKFFTTNKVTKSLYNFVEGADPKLIQQAFESGLINNIYPRHNLQELRHFPQPMVDSIKNFRKRVLKAKDDPIYIKVVSSVLDWQQKDGYKSYHFLEIGLAKSKKEISQSQPMEEQQSFPNNLLKIRVNSLRRISEKILEVLTGTKKKVNYVNNNCIITSWNFSNTNEEDIQAIS
uniref:TPA: orf y n=1 Tax=Tanacetum cinerariifolium TaxID=118510 RepID=A0A6L2MFZ5_TANCI|nr:TPA: orf y [Tanacetum cinerariifolium]